jgi:putative tryptophan/tyrosine transport system substrate-binding protein
MKRREFITLLSGAAVAWPLAARAQQPAMPVVGFLNAASPQDYARPLSAFLKGLGETGYVDGHNVAIEYRWANYQYDRLPALAADLVRHQVSVIAATTTPAALAAKAATTTIPIVFETAADPVQLGLELLHELIPTARVMALLVNPTNPAVVETELREMLSAAHTLELELQVLNVGTVSDFDGALANVIQLRAGGLVIATDVFFTSHSEQLAALAIRHAVPAVYKGREFAAAGGLMGYGSDITDSYRLGGVYTGRILKGDKPADLPVQQATKVELIINLKTAKALGINVPNTLIGRADEVIE